MTSRREKIRESRAGSLLVIALTLVIVFAAASVVQHKTKSGGLTSVNLTGPTNGPAPKVGKSAPDFTATTVEMKKGVDGKEITLSSFKGHAVWLTFGASWCAECQAEAPDIEAAYEKGKADGLIVLAVSIQEDENAVREYANTVGLTFLKVADEDTRIASIYRVNGIPGHFFIDKSGTLRSIRTGTMTPEQIDDALEKIS